jgi:hypothetical protein
MNILEQATLDAVKVKLDYPYSGYPRADKLEEVVRSLSNIEGSFKKNLRIAQSNIIHIVPRYSIRRS